MRYIRQHIYLKMGDKVKISCSCPCSAFLLKEANYDSAFRELEITYDSQQGVYQCTPIEIIAPDTDVWNVLLIFNETQNNKIHYSMTTLPR